VRTRARTKGAVALAVLDLIPPPFPFTPFVLAAGALDVKPRMFFGTLIACRILRFGLEGALAVTYGRGVLSWLNSDLFYDIVLFFIAIAIVLTVLSLIQVVRATRAPRRKRAAA
jgi:membrane protein DedA with SNARE-associated domain